MERYLVQREEMEAGSEPDGEGFGPKTWYRFPILSGGFERELEMLDVVEEE